MADRCHSPLASILVDVDEANDLEDGDLFQSLVLLYLWQGHRRQSLGQLVDEDGSRALVRCHPLARRRLPVAHKPINPLECTDQEHLDIIWLKSMRLQVLDVLCPNQFVDQDLDVLLSLDHGSLLDSGRLEQLAPGLHVQARVIHDVGGALVFNIKCYVA